MLSSPGRTYDAVRARIDAGLGGGQMSAGVAAALLHGADQAVWALDNLLSCVFDDRFHIWDQGFVQADLDGPRLISAIAESAREVNPLIADLLRWTARWPRTRGVALVSVVPELWHRHAEAARAFLFEVAARWPDAIDPLELAEPPPWVRAELTPAPDEPRFPTVAVGFTPQGAGCAVQCQCASMPPAQIFGCIVFALWQAGVPDEALEAFWHEHFERGADQVAVLCRYVSFDGDGGDAARKQILRVALDPPHPLQIWLEVDHLPSPAVVWLPAGALDEVARRLGGWRGVAIDATDVSASTRRALRQDPDVLLVPGNALTDADRMLLLTAVMTGHTLAIAGETDATRQLMAEIAATGVAVFDRRLAR